MDETSADCEYCQNPAAFSLLPAALHTFTNHNREEVTLMMHREINGVTDSAGIECKRSDRKPE